jgi:soluble lytic murein transglycosylase-like protein
LIIIIIFITHSIFANSKLPNYELQQKINYYAHKYYLDPYFVTAVCYVESKYDINAISNNFSDKYHSLGIMQINRKYYKKWKSKDFFNVDKNLDEGCKILRNCRNLADHDYYMGLVYYNFGYGNVNFYNKKVPESTLKYINEIMTLFEIFKTGENN